MIKQEAELVRVLLMLEILLLPGNENTLSYKKAWLYMKARCANVKKRVDLFCFLVLNYFDIWSKIKRILKYFIELVE